jgi:hypothetical protein
MFKYMNKLLEDGGPNISRAINLGVAFILSIALLKLTWIAKEDPGLYYYLCFTTYAVYGMGVHTFNKWLDIIKLKAGGSEAPESKAQ